MEHKKDIIFYDGSFNGFLSLLYEVNSRKLTPDNIQKKNEQQEVLFTDSRFIATDLKKARSVWNSLRSKNYGALKLLYFAFLSEEKHIEWKLYQFYQKLTGNADLYDNGITVSYELHLEQLARSVEKEKYQVEHMLFLDQNGDSPSIHTIHPKFNVLPLISKFFRTRYREKEWVIYDSKRSIGLHHRDGNMSFTSLPLDQLEQFFPDNDHGLATPDRSLKIGTLGQATSKNNRQNTRKIQAVA